MYATSTAITRSATLSSQHLARVSHTAADHYDSVSPPSYVQIFSQNPILVHSLPGTSLNVTDQVPHPYKTTHSTPHYLIFEVADGTAEHSEQNGFTCSLNLICSYFFRACNFYLPVSFSDILPFPHFQTIFLLSSRCNSAPQSVVKVRTQNHTKFSRHLFLDHRP